MISTVTLYAALALASFEDLRIREVPFLLSYGLVIMGVAFSALDAVASNTFLPLLHSVLGGVIAYGLGYAMYVSGQWGGGDVMILTGVATFIGFNPVEPTSFIVYVVLVFVAGSFYGLLWAATLMCRQSDVVREEVPSMRLIRVGVGMGVTAGLGAAAFAVTGLAQGVVLSASVALFALSLTVVYIFRHAEDALTVVRKDPEGLVPGDWLVEDVDVADGVVSSRGEGLSVEDIHRLRHKYDGSVLVRNGVPFVPSFLLAYGLFDVTSIAQVIQVLV